MTRMEHHGESHRREGCCTHPPYVNIRPVHPLLSASTGDTFLHSRTNTSSIHAGRYLSIRLFTLASAPTSCDMVWASARCAAGATSHPNRASIHACTSSLHASEKGAMCDPAGVSDGAPHESGAFE